jgi:tetratricopeptide (TPR) repeat protein
LVRGTQSRQVDIDTLLNQAQHYFRQATSRDPSYTTGYINLACAYSLAGNQPFAIGIINDLEQKHRTDEVSLPGNAYLIRGIALAKNDQLEKARPDFETAVQKKAYQANYNLALYQELSPSWQDALSKNASRYWNWVATFWQQEAPPYKGGKEKGIGEITWSNLRTLPVANSLLLPPPGRPVKIVAVQGANVGGMLLQLSDYTLEIIVTGQTYTGKTLTGISVGSALAELLKQYGEPSYTVAGAGGSTYYCYNGAGIIFELQSERVKRWSISRIQY